MPLSIRSQSRVLLTAMTFLLVLFPGYSLAGKLEGHLTVKIEVVNGCLVTSETSNLVQCNTLTPYNITTSIIKNPAGQANTSNLSTAKNFAAYNESALGGESSISNSNQEATLSDPAETPSGSERMLMVIEF